MNDLISRQAAIEMLNDDQLERFADSVFDGELHRCKRAAQRIIAALKSAEPKKGKWIGTWEKGAYTCSECRFIMDTPNDVTTNYCPNCGARMDGE